MNRKHQKGFINHLIAMQWLTMNDYYVFDNVSGLGPCDVIAMNEAGNIMKIDINVLCLRKSLIEITKNIFEFDSYKCLYHNKL